MASALETAIVQAIAADRELIRLLIEQETPFENGILPITSGGTGEVTAGAALAALGGVGASHNHAATDINSGTMAPARLGSGASASTTLHGDSTFSLVDIVSETTSTLSIARGGTGATSAAAALSALGGVGASHNHAGADITSGTVSAARLGSGTPSATTLLWGDSTWAALVAGDIPNLDTSKLTSGTMATARLGSGTANSTTWLRGDSTWAAISAVTGTGVANQLSYFTGTSTIAADSGLTWDSGANQLGVGGKILVGSVSGGATGDIRASGDVSLAGGLYVGSGSSVAANGTITTTGDIDCGGGIQTVAGVVWNLGSYTATVSTIIGYMTILADGSTRKLAVVS